MGVEDNMVLVEDFGGGFFNSLIGSLLLQVGLSQLFEKIFVCQCLLDEIFDQTGLDLVKLTDVGVAQVLYESFMDDFDLLIQRQVTLFPPFSCDLVKINTRSEQRLNLF